MASPRVSRRSPQTFRGGVIYPPARNRYRKSSIFRPFQIIPVDGHLEGPFVGDLLGMTTVYIPKFVKCVIPKGSIWDVNIYLLKRFKNT